MASAVTLLSGFEDTDDGSCITWSALSESRREVDKVADAVPTAGNVDRRRLKLFFSPWPGNDLLSSSPN